MYGTDTTQAAALATTGAGTTLFTVGWGTLAAGVLILAGLTLFTIAAVLRHRRRKAQ